MTPIFDAIIVGAGQAGPALANRLTGAGKTVAIIERHLVGGTCVNTGCKHTKTLVASAYAARLAQRGAEYGVVTGAVHIDMPTIAARARKVILDSRKGNEDWLAGMPALTSCWRMLAPKTSPRAPIGAASTTTPAMPPDVAAASGSAPPPWLWPSSAMRWPSMSARDLR